MGTAMRACVWAAMMVGAMLATPVAVAQPDFAGTFKRLDANKDGVLSVGELRYEGVEAERYSRPVGTYVTDDGFGVELWESPFGARAVSMTTASLETRKHQRSRTFPRDERINLAPWLMLAANPEYRSMTLERFETELRRNAEPRIAAMDADKDGGVSSAEVEQMLFAQAEDQRLHPGFQSGAGGDALRARSRELRIVFYAQLDLNDDGVFTTDEMLEVILERMIAAFALPPH